LDEHAHDADDDNENPVYIHDFLHFCVYGAKIMEISDSWVKKILSRDGFPYL
jgi:hypothetical protein